MKFAPSTDEIRSIFESEIHKAGGKVTDVFDDGSRVLLRSVLPDADEIRRGDRVQGGVALRAMDDLILVHPYVFRQVCSNGAIMAQAVQTRKIERVMEGGLPWEIERPCEQLRDAVMACADPEVFQTATEQLRIAAHSEADMAITLMSYLSRWGPAVAGPLIAQIMGRFHDEGDRTAFGLMNAVTSTARDTTDPELRWKLEELGGGVPTRVVPARDRRGAKSVMASVG